MYRWLAFDEITSGVFKTFNKRNSTFRETEYPGVIWEYPWISLLLNYESSGSILLCAGERFTDIFKKEHPFADITTWQQWEAAGKQRRFDVIIVENITGPVGRYAKWLNPFGKLICTYRYGLDETDGEEFEKLQLTELLPWRPRECDVLPNDPKYQQVKKHTWFTDPAGKQVTSLAMVFFQPAQAQFLETCRFAVNPMWLDGQKRVISYTDHREAVNTIGLTDEKYCRIFSLPEEMLSDAGCSLQDVCRLYGTDRQTGCVLLNELVAEEVLLCKTKESDGYAGEV